MNHTNQKYIHLFDWEEVHSSIASIDDLNPYEKHRAVYAVDKFKRMCETHPAITQNIAFSLNQIQNRVAWQARLLIKYAEDLTAVQGCLGWENIVRKIASPENFNEGISLLDIGHRVFKTGLEVAFEQPFFSESRSRLPDMRIMNRSAGDTIYLEDSALNASEFELEYQRLIDVIMRPGRFQLTDYAYAGCLKKIVSRNTAEEIGKALADASERARATGFAEVAQAGKFDFAICPTNNISTLQAWCKKKELPVNTFSWTMPDVNHIARLSLKIKEKTEQLPADSASIIFIRSNVFNLISESKLKNFLDSISEVVYNANNVGLFVLQESYGGMCDERIDYFGDTIFAKRNFSDFRFCNNAIVVNRYCNFKVAPSTLIRALSAFLPET